MNLIVVTQEIRDGWGIDRTWTRWYLNGRKIRDYTEYGEPLESYSGWARHTDAVAQALEFSDKLEAGK